ncbi:MAG: S8 family serine peptidase, partial [Caldilineaceae bacterium]|nr:S8 family serine peptidase [Caldilineaceae bacterium]
MPYGDPTDNELEVWYPGVDRFTAAVFNPTGVELAVVKAGQDIPLVDGGTVVGHIYHYIRQSLNGDHHIDLFLKPHAPEGTWELRLKGDAIEDGHYHAWIERDRGLQPRFVRSDVNRNFTTGTLCNGRLSITVGAYDPHHTDGSLGRFSSAGPTRDGRVKPELVAPGVGIRAARSAPPSAPPKARYTNKSGTSMAAPHVTGAIALLFEAASTPLSITDTRALLLSSTNRSPLESGVLKASDLHRVGYGYLDLVAVEKSGHEWAMAHADSEQTSSREVDTEVADVNLADLKDEQLVDNVTDVTMLNDDLVDLADRTAEETDIVFPQEASIIDSTSPDAIAWRDAIQDSLILNHGLFTPSQLQELALSAIGASADSPLFPIDVSADSHDKAIRPGDLLVRFAPFEGIRHSAIVISVDPENPTALVSRGIPIEWSGPGAYVEVLETPFGSGPVRSVGRRLTDSWGRMLRGQTCLRPDAAGPASESRPLPESELPSTDTRSISDALREPDVSDVNTMEQVGPATVSEGSDSLLGENDIGSLGSSVEDSVASDDALDEAWADQDQPFTPAHAGGVMGELDAAFALGQRGFSIIIGPGGPSGHR